MIVYMLKAVEQWSLCVSCIVWSLTAIDAPGGFLYEWWYITIYDEGSGTMECMPELLFGL